MSSIVSLPSDPSLRDKSERMRRNLQKHLAEEQARAEKELQRIKANVEALNPKDYPHLLLSSYNRFQKRNISWACSMLANELGDPEALGIDSASKEAGALTTAASLFRDELPVKLTRVLLKGNDDQIGEFTLEVGDGPNFPSHLWVCLRGKNGSPVRLGYEGHLLQGGPYGQIRAAQSDLGRAIKSVVQIIRNGGLYCAISWADPRFTITRSQGE